MYSAEKTVPLASGAEQAAQSHASQWSWSLPHTVHSINSKWLRDFDVRHDILKIPEKNIGKTFSDVIIIIFS